VVVWAGCLHCSACCFIDLPITIKLFMPNIAECVLGTRPCSAEMAPSEKCYGMCNDAIQKRLRLLHGLSRCSYNSHELVSCSIDTDYNQCAVPLQSVPAGVVSGLNPRSAVRSFSLRCQSSSTSSLSVLRNSCWSAPAPATNRGRAA